MRTIPLSLMLFVVTGCAEETNCSDTSGQDEHPVCSDEFSAEPGDVCDEAEDASCEQDGLLMSCNEGVWVGSVHAPKGDDCD